MRCSTCREQLSADLDGEAGQEAELAEARRHLHECPDCTRWLEQAATVNRLIRTASADPAPGLTERQLTEILDQLPRPRRRGWSLAARWALAGVGAVQATLSGVALALSGASEHAGHGQLLGAGMAHMSRESSAWNLALGVAFLAGAVWVRHLAGVLPLLGCFVLVLSLVSAVDLAAGRVEATRVFAHALVLAGFGLIVLIVATLPSRSGPSPPEFRTRWAAKRGKHGTAEPQLPPMNTPPVVGRPDDPAARRRVA